MADPFKQYIKGRANSFKYAFSGLAYVVLTQRNGQIHLAATIIVVILALFSRLNPIETAIVLLCTAIVWITELFNTAVEALVDLCSPGFHPLAQTSKDIAAAAVLVSAILSAAIGLLIFYPHLSALFIK